MVHSQVLKQAAIAGGKVVGVRRDGTVDDLSELVAKEAECRWLSRDGEVFPYLEADPTVEHSHEDIDWLIHAGRTKGYYILALADGEGTFDRIRLEAGAV